MTDNERFEEWWAENSRKFPPQVRDSGVVQRRMAQSFLAALAIGRKERTVEIAKAWGYADVGLHDDDLEDELHRVYPECFGEGDGNA